MRGYALGLLLAIIIAVSTPLNGTAQNGASRETPLPFASIAQIGDYAVSVVSVNYDAAPIIIAENQFNQPPAAGNVFVMVRVSTGYTGAEIANPGIDLEFNAVGSLNRGYSNFDSPGCGVIPEGAFEVGEVFTGALVEFNVCWQVTAAEAPTLIMYAGPLFGIDAPTFFSLSGAPAPAQAIPAATPSGTPAATPVT